jgi:phage baseplate assembly protein V
MEALLNLLKQHAGALDQGSSQPRLATVTSVDSSSATVRVTLQPEGVLTGWLPVLSPWIGAGWGMYCPPSPGDQVLVLAQEGEAEHGIVVGRAFSNQHAPPATPVGELWLMHQTGSFIKLQNDGTIRMQGDLYVSGDVYDKQGSMARLRGHYNAHTHGVGQGTTTAPNQLD